MAEFKILYTQSKEVAEQNKFDVTIEMEYGDHCVEGEKLTLAHHGSRSGNPVPCLGESYTDLNPKTIGISHFDLDTLGAIMRVINKKCGDEELWKWIGYFDINGIHHMFEAPQEYRKFLTAMYYIVESKRLSRATDTLLDVTEDVLEVIKTVEDFFTNEEKQQAVISEAEEWQKKKDTSISKALIYEDLNMRVFVTNGTFCAASYYSENLDAIIPTTITLNLATKAVTIGFEDGGKRFSASAIAKKLWGDKAGGRDGIAGSPRDWECDLQELLTQLGRACGEVKKNYQEDWIVV